MNYTPYVLLIEDSPRHAQATTKLLKSVGFQVMHALSLAEGLTLANRMLDPAATVPPPLLVVDLMLPYESHPDLEGVSLIAHVVEAIEQEKLRPTHIVGITAKPTAQRQQELLHLGCRTLLIKPFTHKYAMQLRTLADTPPPDPGAFDQEGTFQQALGPALRREARNIIALLRAPHGAQQALAQQPPLLIVTHPAYTPVNVSPSRPNHLFFKVARAQKGE